MIRAMSNTNNSSHNSVRFVEISTEQAGQRIDNYLITLLKGVPKSRIYRILRKGEVRVNKGRVKPTYRLKPQDMVRVPPIRLEDKPTAERPPDKQIERIENAIIFEDKGLIIINKPAGLAVHGGSGLSFGIIELLRASRPTAPYLELVHRLDRDTSGCLMIAKKRSYLRHLHEQLRTDRQVRKHYRALLCGHWDKGKHHENAPLLKVTHSSGERIVRVDEAGKASHTLFNSITRHKEASYMEIELFTGRTHQIRVHAAHCGHPVAGDDKYGTKDCNKLLQKRGLNRLFLHAYRLEFQHPSTGQDMDIIAPLGTELNSVLDNL